MGSDHTVRFSKGTLHPVQIRERRGPSQGVTQTCEPQERSPCALKFEERTQDETLQQERCVHREAWDLARNDKLKNEDKATFYSPTEAWVMLAPSSKKPEEREFVVDSGASMHMMGKKELSSDELDTLRCAAPRGRISFRS